MVALLLLPANLPDISEWYGTVHSPACCLICVASAPDLLRGKNGATQRAARHFPECPAGRSFSFPDGLARQKGEKRRFKLFNCTPSALRHRGKMFSHCSMRAKWTRWQGGHGAVHAYSIEFGTLL